MMQCECFDRDSLGEPTHWASGALPERSDKATAGCRHNGAPMSDAGPDVAPISENRCCRKRTTYCRARALSVKTLVGAAFGIDGLR